MVRKAIRILLIPGVLYFSFQLLSLGLPAGIPVVILIAVAVLLLTGKKEEVINTVEAAGKWGQERAEIASVLAVQCGKVVASGIKAGYQEMGGTEGAKKAVDELSKASEEALKITGYAVVKSVEAVGNAVKAVGKQVEEDRRRKQQKKLPDDVIRNANYTILDDD